MKLYKRKVLYHLRQNRKEVATGEFARDLKVSQMTVLQIIKEYKETGQESISVKKVGHPANSSLRKRRRL
jgi:Mn-dependent DtxR family transcriptional regulator